MNWEDLRFFLAIAKAGTISSAAKDLNVDQATVSRRLASLEADPGVQLFIRLPRESRLTPTGEKILNEAKEIEAKVFTVARLSSSVKTSAHSRVAISAPPILARHFFAPAIYQLAQRNPEIQLAIQSEPQFVSLAKMEADLSLRLSAPIEETDIIKKAGLMKFGLYAAPHYKNLTNPALWEFIAYTHKEPDFAHKRWLYALAGKRRVCCEVSDLSNQYEAACSGIGVAGLPCFLADKEPRLIKLPAEHPLLTLDIWLAKHPDRRDDRQIRKLATVITEFLERDGLGLHQ
ncbi:LysR family transcriptional regulator [Erwinia aphidicola]|uniref:LysR family transcriptional regulator n=1 Tax=Erwinia aphidicola TaxID=68334 RepID=UPI0030D592D8